MKIAILSSVYLPAINGVVRSIEANRGALEKLGHEVYVIAPKHRGYKDKEERIKRFPVSVRIKKDYHLYLPFSRKIGRILKESDVIHVQHPFLEAITALYRKRLYKKPVIFTYHSKYDEYSKSYIPYIGKNSYFRKALRVTVDRFCNSCNYVIAPSEGIKEMLLQRGIKTPIAVVPTGIELSRFKADKNKIRRKYNIKGILLLYLGRIAKDKNIDALLNVYEVISKKKKNVNLMIVGEIKDKRIIKKAKNLKNVIFTGVISPGEVPEYYAAADLFVSASQIETQGITYAEAMASGLPIVAMGCWGSRDAVNEGKNGFITDSQEGFAEKIILLSKDRKLRKKFSRESKRIAKRFDVKNTSRKLIAVYKKSINRSL